MNNTDGKRDYISELIEAILREAGIPEKSEGGCPNGCPECEREAREKTVRKAKANAKHEIELAESEAAPSQIVVLGEHELDNSKNVGLVQIEYDRNNTDKVRVVYEGNYEPIVTALAWALQAHIEEEGKTLVFDDIEDNMDELYKAAYKIARNNIFDKFGPVAGALFLASRGCP